ncbi:hypothetical protein V2J09_002662 [Rumex salicifolius]
MEVTIGFLAKLCNFLWFLPYFFLLLILGNLKACLVAPVVLGLIGVGNSAVIIGLWPAHLIWTYYCVLKTRRLGVVLKSLLLLLLPVPLVLWPVVGITGSVLGGVAYGYFAPLIATFEAVGENVGDKFYHCFMDGIWSTLEGSCTVVRDFTDFSFHSYFSLMDELTDKFPSEANTIDVKLSRIPGSLLVCIVALPVDVLSITGVALWKSPYMLFRGWKRLLEDLVGREGPFLETVCVPFAGLAIILWPAAVIGAVIAALFSSFFLALYAGVIVHQEDSIKMGFAYIVAVISLFDEYANDMLYLREGSCVPRPRYRRNLSSSLLDNHRKEDSFVKEGSNSSKLMSQHSRTLKEKMQHYKPIQVLDWLFKSCEVEGRKLLHDGLIDVKDIENCVVNGDCKKLGVVLPAWCILKCLLASSKSDSPGLVVSEDVELVMNTWTKDKVWQWFTAPLLIMKEQIKKLTLEDNETEFLRRLIMKCNNQRPEDWDGVGFPCNDSVKRAQLQAIIRRLQGIVASMSRMPTCRRRLQNLVKVLYLESVKTGVMVNYVVETSRNDPDGASGSEHLKDLSKIEGENMV